MPDLITTEEKAYAKINIGLDVLGRRPDGYHELRMVMQTIGLCDDVILAISKAEEGKVGTEPEQEPGIKSPEKAPEIRILCDTPGVPTDRRNLAYRAAEAFFVHLYNKEAEAAAAGSTGRESADFAPGLRPGDRLEIRLVKRIPAAAGLAGGSSDAAAVLRGLNRLLKAGLSEEALREIALPLGADVPYCVSGGTMLAEGIGEVLTRLPDFPDCGIVLVKPPFDCSTAEIYGNLHADLLKPEEHPDMESVLAAVRAGDLRAAAERMGNVLEKPALCMHPEITEIKERFVRAGAAGASMSGSGSAVFGIFLRREDAESCCGLLRREEPRWEVFLTSPAYVQQ